MYETPKTSPEMIAYYEGEKEFLEGKVKDGTLIEQKFADGTSLYTMLKLSGEEFGVAISVNDLIIRSGDTVKIKKYTPIREITKDDITVSEFATNYYKTGIDFAHHPNYSGDGMKLTQIAENITAGGRQLKQERRRQQKMAARP